MLNNIKGLPEKKLRSKFSSGFTLIELLVVIAIIGMLAATVLTSLGTARSKGRDAKRIADLQNIQLAISLFSDSNRNKVPDDIYATGSGTLMGDGFLQNTPLDPDGQKYNYTACRSSNSATNKTRYHLGAQLENISPVLESDADANSLDSSTFPGGCTGTNFNGAEGSTAPYWYDVRN